LSFLSTGLTTIPVVGQSAVELGLYIFASVSLVGAA
jgi:hypothetical protein